MTLQQRQGFKALGRQIAPRNPHSKRASLTGKQAYEKLNLVRQACGMSFLSDAPQMVVAPQPLPDWTVSAAYSAGPGSVFDLTILSPGYVGTVMIYVSASLSPGMLSVPSQSLRLLQVDSSLSASGTSLGAAYRARFGSPSVGMQVGVCLIPVSDVGWAGMAAVKNVEVTVTG